jgi:hypothetical protein
MRKIVEERKEAGKGSDSITRLLFGRMLLACRVDIFENTPKNNIFELTFPCLEVSWGFSVG